MMETSLKIPTQNEFSQVHRIGRVYQKHENYFEYQRDSETKINRHTGRQKDKKTDRPTVRERK